MAGRRAGRGFLLKPLRPIVRKTGASGVATVAGDVVLTAVSTLTTAGVDTVLPAVALAAVGTLTPDTALPAVSLTAVSILTVDAAVTEAAAVAMVAAATLTTTAVDTVPVAVALTAASTLTAAAATETVLGAVALVAISSLITTATITKPGAAALVASSSLTASAATPVTAAVALSATSTLTIVGTVVAPGMVSLGAVTVAAGPVTALDMAQPGTLANPYAASDSDTRSLDFASALFVATEPVAHTGPPAAPSIWYEFTELQAADWLASTSSFAHGATIELYSGPPGAGPDDLTFIATDGSSLVTLGAVTLSALVTTVATPLRVRSVDLGAVAVAASPAVAVVLS